MRKQKAKIRNKAFIIRALLDPGNPYSRVRQRVWRDIAVLSSQNLYNLAESIIDSFGFDFDHCFGFFDSLKTWVGSKEKYELFTDLPDTEKTPGAKSVKKTKINQVFKQQGNKMLFLFDYGDNWEFVVELLKVALVDRGKPYPFVVAKVGRAPKQY